MKAKTICPLLGAGLLLFSAGMYSIGLEAERAAIIANAKAAASQTEMAEASPRKFKDSSKKVQKSADRKISETRAESAFRHSDKIPLDPFIQYKLKEIAAENGIPHVLALAVIDVESSFDPNAANGGCYGLMQVSAIHAPKEILLDPVSNIRLGCGLLGTYYRKYKDWNKALTVYNRGEAGAQGALVDRLFAESPADKREMG